MTFKLTFLFPDFKQIDPPLYHAPATYKSSFVRFTLFTAIDHLFSSVLSSVMFFNHYASFHWWHCFTSWLEAQQRCSGWVYWLSPSKQIKVFCWPSCLWLLLIILPSVRTSKLITHFTVDWPLSNLLIYKTHLHLPPDTCLISRVSFGYQWLHYPHWL